MVLEDLVSMLTLVHEGKSIELKPDTLLIVQNADLALYERLATENLKIDFDGVRLFIHSPASYRHEKIIFNILKIFEKYFADNPGKGDAVGSVFSIKLPDGKRVEPDVVVIPSGLNPDTSVFEGVPPLILEVVSPSNRDHDLIDKKSWYEENGVPEFWFIDPQNKSISLHYKTLEGKYEQKTITKGALSSKILQGLSISLKMVLFE